MGQPGISYGFIRMTENSHEEDNGSREVFVRVAYSCAGEGFGHAARMVALYEDLQKDCQVFLFVPEPVQDFVKYRLPEAKLFSIPCFEFVKQNNRIRYLPTVLEGIRRGLHFIPAVRRLAKKLMELHIDVVLSDFEPYLPWAARLAGIPIVQMNHPGIVHRFITWDPRSWLASLVARLMEGPWDKRVLVSFYYGDVGPVLRPSLHRYTVKDEGFFAVNLKEDARKRILPLLERHLPGRYQLFPEKGKDFDYALTHCTAVISTAGHQTISEALVLGKPILAVAQDGQYEQMLNARMLEASGRGMGCTTAGLAATLPRFFQFVRQYRVPRIILPRFCFKNSQAHLLQKLKGLFVSLTGKELLPLFKENQGVRKVHSA